MVPQDDAGQDSTSGSWSGSADGDEIASPPPPLVAIVEEASAVGTVIKWLFLLGLAYGGAVVTRRTVLRCVPASLPRRLLSRLCVAPCDPSRLGISVGRCLTNRWCLCGNRATAHSMRQNVKE